MGKFKARYIVIPVLVLSIIGSAAAGAINKKNSSTTANVVLVSEADQSSTVSMYYSDTGGYTGTLKKGSVQNVKLNEDLKIDEVLVKKGDSVKKGDKLFTYDLNSLKIALAEAENSLKSAENDIKAAENELAVLKKLQPSENAPQTITQNTVPDDEPEVETPDQPTPIAAPEFKYDKKITAKLKYADGKGTAEEPYVFYVGEDTVVTKAALKSFCPENEEAKYALFYVCDETGAPLYARLVDGNKIDKDKVKDWNVNDGVSVDATGVISFDGGSANFASFIIQSQVPSDTPDLDLSQLESEESYEGMEELFGYPEDNNTAAEQPAANTNEEVSDEITEKDNYKFSKDELKSMITAKEKEIENLNLNKRQCEIDVEKAKKNLETGAELAILDGKVTFVAKDIKHLSESGAYVTITSSTGMSVASSIGEFSLSKIDIGTKMAITNYDDGSNYTGEITSISDVPFQGDESRNENATESFYEFVVTVDKSFEMQEDGSVSMKIVEEDEEEKITLDNIFVRAEGAKYYVMVANKDDVIEKRYITIDKRIYDWVVISSGLSEGDRVAIAYGKTKEGMKAVDSSYETVAYGSSLFY